MKNIEIKTAQNVVLEYELADFRDRVLAYLIDMSVLGVGIILVAIISGLAGVSSTAFYRFFIYFSIAFYSLAMEIFNNGQSVGKMAMRIQVIKASGGQAHLAEFSARWVFRLVDIYLSLGGIASILVASSARAQRIGDIVADTAVIKVQPKATMNLDDLLRLHSTSTYVPRYTAVRRLPESDMLLIKSTIDRHSKFDNVAHKEALHMMAERVQQVLEIQNQEGDEKRFLQAILKDYVMLTR